MGLSVENRSPLFAFSTAVATALGAVTALASVIAWLRYAARLLERGAEVEPLFPTPAAARGRRD